MIYLIGIRLVLPFKPAVMNFTGILINKKYFKKLQTIFSIQLRTHLLSLMLWIVQVNMLQQQHTEMNIYDIHT